MASIPEFVALLLVSLLISCNASPFHHPQYVKRVYNTDADQFPYSEESSSDYFLERNGRALVEPKDETLYEIKHVADLPMFRFG